MTQRLFLIGLLFLTGVLGAQGQNLQLGKHDTTVYLNNFIQYFVDESGEFDVEEIRASYQDSFIPARGEAIRFPVSENHVWLNFKIRNNDRYRKKYVVEFNDPSIYYLECYTFKEGAQVKVDKTGTSIPQEERSLKGNKNNLLIALDGNTQYEFFVRTYSTNYLTLSARFIPFTKAVSKYDIERTLLGLFYGFLLMLFFYAILIFLATKMEVFLQYAIYVLFIGLFTGAADGFLATYFHFIVDWTKGYQDVLTAVMSNVWGLFFMLAFLEISKWSLRLYRVTQYYIVGLIVLIIVFFFLNIQLMFLALQIFGILTVIWTIYVGIEAVRKKVALAPYFLIAYVVFGLFILIFILNLFRVLDYSFFVQYSIHFGYAFSLMIISYSLGVRVNAFYRESLDREREKQEIIQEKNRELEQKVAERTKILVQKEINLRTILDNNDNSIWLIDADMKIIDFNILFGRMWELAFEKKLIQGESLPEQIDDPQLREMWTARYKESLEDNQKVYIDTYEIGGVKYWYEITSYPIRQNNKVEGVTFFSKDITSKILSDQRLKDQNEKLKKANQELDSFVYSASHDLKAPLASVLGLINLVKTEKDDAARMEYYEMMEQSVGRLDQFIKDIIDYSRNERIGLKPEKIDFDLLIQNALQDLSYVEGADSIIKKIEISGNETFVSDKMRLHVVVRNLLSNAIRYGCTPHLKKRQIDIHVKANSEKCSISVKDYGTGIPPEHLNKIFDMFYRAHDNSTGTGLGLYIVKETVDKLNGNISVNSEMEVGTTFTVNLESFDTENIIE